MSTLLILITWTFQNLMATLPPRREARENLAQLYVHFLIFFIDFYHIIKVNQTHREEEPGIFPRSTVILYFYPSPSPAFIVPQYLQPIFSTHREYFFLFPPQNLKNSQNVGPFFSKWIYFHCRVQSLFGDKKNSFFVTKKSLNSTVKIYPFRKKASPFLGEKWYKKKYSHTGKLTVLYF